MSFCSEALIGSAVVSAAEKRRFNIFMLYIPKLTFAGRPEFARHLTNG